MNILELHFHKNLQYKISSILILFTYFIAILIPFLAGQLQIQNSNDVFLVAIISSVVISIIFLLLRRFDFHLKNILKEMERLK